MTPGDIVSGRAHVAVPVALVLGWASLWAATVPLGNVPLNDDWTYALAVKSILETGRFSLLSWSTANVFAQAYWGALFCTLFGFSYEVLRISTAVLGAVGIVATYGLLRELRARVGVAALGTAAVGCNPLYLSQCVTFMTDIPFAALVIVSLWLFAVSLRRERLLPGLAAYGVGLLAVLVRQFAVVLPVAFAAPLLRQRRLSAGLLLMLLGSMLLFAALHLGFQRWMVATRRTTGFEQPVSALLHLDIVEALRRLRSGALPFAGVVGMGVLPFALVDPSRFWGGERRTRLIWWGVTIGLAAVLLAVMVWKHEVPPLAGNVLERSGIGPLTLSDTYMMRRNRPTLPWATLAWPLLSAGACWGLAVAAVAVMALVMAVARGRRLGSERQAQAAMLLGFIASYGGAMLVLALMTPLFDRYSIALLTPLVAVMVVARRGDAFPRASLALGGLAVTLMAIFSVLGTHDWLAWHRTRWEAVGYLQARSVPPAQIDGGYEFNGLTTYRPVAPTRSDRPGWWVVDNEYMVAAGPVDGFHQIAAFPVATWLWRPGVEIVVLRRD